jgi:putative holliday junction resolvase
MKQFMGIDLGSKTIGVAISTSGLIATALGTYRFKENHYQEAIEVITNIVKDHQIDIIVLGYPKHMNNDVGERGKISEMVKTMLMESTQKTVVLWDERLSTKTALDAMILGNSRRSKQKQKKDEIAAVIILQNYLDYKGAKPC